MEQERQFKGGRICNSHPANVEFQMNIQVENSSQQKEVSKHVVKMQLMALASLR